MLNSGSEFGPTISTLAKAIRDSQPLSERQVRKALPEPEMGFDRGLEKLRSEIEKRFPGMLKAVTK